MSVIMREASGSSPELGAVYSNRSSGGRERAHDSTNKAQVLGQLRREILAARLKVVLDEQLGLETSPVVLRLYKMKVPPIARPQHRVCGTQASRTEAATEDS